MKMKAKLSPLVLATSLAVTGMAVPMASQAELSASVAASNMYLWRGQNLSPDGGVISGSLDFSTGGFYAGGWTSSENGGSEMDYYLGFGGEAGDFSYDINYTLYTYPEEDGPDGSLSDSSAADVIGSLGYMGFGLALYYQVGSNYDNDLYYVLSYGYNAFTFSYGAWNLEDKDSGESFGADYSHVQIDYAPIDELTFSVSKQFGDDTTEDDALFAVTYGLSFDL